MFYQVCLQSIMLSNKGFFFLILLYINCDCMPPVLSVSTVHSQGWNHPPGKRLEFKMLPPGFYLDMLWSLSLKWQTWDCWFDWLRSSCSQTGNMTLMQTCLEMLGHTLYYLFQQFMHVRACVYVCVCVCVRSKCGCYIICETYRYFIHNSDIYYCLYRLLYSQSPNTIWRPTDVSCGIILHYNTDLHYISIVLQLL